MLEATANAQCLGAVPDHAVCVLASVGYNLGEVGHLDTSRLVLDRAWPSQAQLGPDHLHTLATRANLANWQNKRDSDG